VDGDVAASTVAEALSDETLSSTSKRPAGFKGGVPGDNQMILAGPVMSSPWSTGSKDLATRAEKGQDVLQSGPVPEKVAVTVRPRS
jgi:hypothetical protein